jgi:hypothetical protein
MRTPARRQKTYAKRITKLASQDDETNKLLMDIVAAINETTADNPYMKDKDLKKKIIKQFMKDGHDDLEIARLYEAASHQVIPFFSSGRKMAQADSILDTIAREAKENLIQDVYDKNGNPVGTRFDASVAGVVIKAVKAKMDTLTKMQGNVISAQSKHTQEKESKNFEIEDADREQLEKLVAGDLIEHPEIVDKLLESSRENDTVQMFYEVTDDE